MSAHVLLIFLFELGERDKTWGLSGILSLFHNNFNEFTNKRARIFDNMYYMKWRFSLKTHFSRICFYNFAIMYTMLLWTSLHFLKIYKVVYLFYCMTLFHSKTRIHVIKCNCILITFSKVIACNCNPDISLITVIECNYLQGQKWE